jgi:hypothetical protein
MEIVPLPVQQQTSLPTQAQTPGLDSASGSVLQKAAAVKPAQKLDQKDISANPDQQKNNREAAVQKAAELFRDFFPVSDVTFSIFKDSSGQYVTRFTSLRDGKVTYVPEQDMFAYLKRAGRQYNNVKINA